MIYEGVELIDLLSKAYAVTLIAGILCLFLVPEKIKALTGIFFVISVAVLTSLPAVNCLTKDGFEIIFYGGSFLGNIVLRLDSLSAWFILIINITSVTGAIYGAGYLKKTSRTGPMITFHWALYLIFQSSMILVTVIQHGIAFLIMWEIMSLSSLFLVLFENENPNVLKAGINYLVQMHLSVVLLTVAFLWAFLKTGTFDFSGIGQFFGHNKNQWLSLLFLAGFGFKAGFLGLHTWLPEAHPAAPSHISGVMSGVIVKMGIYGIFRILTFLQSDYVLLGEIILTISVLTGIFGIMNAAVHRDFKKMLAYCTIENIGIIGAGIGLGLLGLGTGKPLMSFFGFSGALVHTLNHSLFKSLLFFSAGSVYSQTHTRNMDELGGIMKFMPKTGFIFLTGAVAIGGIPPLNGFVSEFLIYSGIIYGFNSSGIALVTLMIVTFAGMSLIGGISILTFTKSFGTIFLGTPRKKLNHQPEEVPFLMLFPQYLILIMMLLIAFFPAFIMDFSGRVAGNSYLPGNSIPAADIQKYALILKKISLASLFFLAITGAVMLFRRALTRKTPVLVEPTWGCGYSAPNERMQYTGKSFSKSMGKLLNFVLIEKKVYREINQEEYFPEKRTYRSTYMDIIGSGFIDPLLKLISQFISLFKFVQNGRIQAYVIYGIIFILLIFIGTVLNLWH